MLSRRSFLQRVVSCVIALPIVGKVLDSSRGSETQVADWEPFYPIRSSDLDTSIPVHAHQDGLIPSPPVIIYGESRYGLDFTANLMTIRDDMGNLLWEGLVPSGAMTTFETP